jgi:hypothetical protein
MPCETHLSEAYISVAIVLLPPVRANFQILTPAPCSPFFCPCRSIHTGRPQKWGGGSLRVPPSHDPPVAVTSCAYVSPVCGEQGRIGASE